MKKRFIIPLIIIFSVILSICVSAQPSQADTPLENSESYTDVSVQESANQLYESLMSAFNSANGKNSSTPSQLSYPDAYGGAYINDSGKLVIYVVESKIEDSSDIDSTIEDISNFSPADNVLDSTTADYVLEPCEYSYTDLNNIMDLLNNYKINNQGSEIANNFKKFGLYDSENRVIVYLEEFNEEKIKEFKENVCDSDAIVFAQGFGAIETQSSWSPGQPARNASDQGALTLGYRAKFGSTIGIVTAAHAVKMGEELIWNGDRFAKATIRNLGGSCDAVFCKMINSHDATNTLYGTGNSNKKVGKFSLGMRQKLGIAQAIMENPDILILDEPFNGLDKDSVKEMRSLLLSLRDAGKLILLASHNPLDISLLCDSAFEIDRGMLFPFEITKSQNVVE